jgi:D-serine deaminase-like pyridoxal phosphate-dependent protein
VAHLAGTVLDVDPSAAQYAHGFDPRSMTTLDTPALVVDLDAFEANVTRCFEQLGERVAVRPHLKTAKSPAVARRLLQAGANGICVAKLGEAEVMLEAGLDDILITTELVGELKANRLAQLVVEHPGRRISIVVDNADAAQRLDEQLARAGAGPVDALIDVNVGQDRCGVDPRDAAELADRVGGLCPLLRIVGVQGYEGHLQHVPDRAERGRRCLEAMDRLAAAADALRDTGHAVDIVTTGGTGTATMCADHPAVTEVQPGSFMFMDAHYGAVSGVDFEAALHVWSTVISCPTADRAIVDAGLKTLSDDSGPARCVLSGWSYQHAGDEHGTLRRDGEARPLQVGDIVQLQPSHSDTTINLHDVLHTRRGDAIQEIWAIAARGRVD